MLDDFPRVLALLRKEKGLSQKEAAEKLGVSQALLSHYEKGIRECGLDFLVKAANFYGVSADYLLGRSADPEGLTVAVEDIPEADAAGKETVSSKVGVLPLLNKKLVTNSMNILFDLAAKSESKELTKAVSGYVMASVYRMFRIIYGLNPKNNMDIFSVKGAGALDKVDVCMKKCEAKLKDMDGLEEINKDALLLSNETIQKTYPLFSSSFFSLIKNSEDMIEK